MNFFTLAENRHSIRKFSQKKVSAGTTKKIINIGKTAPSAGNLKAYSVRIVRDEKIKQKLAAAAYDQEFAATAPVVLVFCALPDKSGKHYGKRGTSLYAIQDATIACAYTQLAAADAGLGSCWIGAFDERKVCAILELHESDGRPIAILPIGYAR